MRLVLASDGFQRCRSRTDDDPTCLQLESVSAGLMMTNRERCRQCPHDMIMAVDHKGNAVVCAKCNASLQPFGAELAARTHQAGDVRHPDPLMGGGSPRETLHGGIFSFPRLRSLHAAHGKPQKMNIRTSNSALPTNHTSAPKRAAKKWVRASDLAVTHPSAVRDGDGHCKDGRRNGATCDSRHGRPERGVSKHGGDGTC